MNPEYLLNIDTQEFTRRIGELALQDEPTLRANCQEVSRQTDTSCLRLHEEALVREQALKASVRSAASILQELVRALSASAGIFERGDQRADFSAVCRAVIGIEELRVRLIAEIDAQARVRSSLASSVAAANRALHFLSVAEASVPVEKIGFYAEAIQTVKAAYARFLALDGAIQEAQKAYMSLVELHFSSFLQRARAAADFAHTGASLNRAELRALCGELLLLLERLGRSSFGENCDEKI